MANPGYPATLGPAWRPGQSGNSGSKAYKGILRHARIKSLDMLKIAIACAEDTEAPWPARVNAALAVLDRAWGKPKEHVQVDGNGIATLRIQFVDARDEQNGTVIDAETFQIALNGHGEEAASAPLQQEEEP